MLLQKIALKNLSRQKRRSFLLGGALAFGILILTLVNGVVGGMLTSIERNFSNIAVGHIFFTEIERTANGRILMSIEDDRPLLEAIDRLDIPIRYFARRTMHDGTLVFAGESAMRGLAGVDWIEETQIAGTLEMLAGTTEGMAGSDGILLSEGAAERLRLIPKDKPDAKTMQVWDTLPKPEREAKLAEWREARDEAIRRSVGESILVELSTIHGQQNLGEFRVHGIFRTQFDIYAYTDRTVLNRLIGMADDGYNQFGAFLEDFGQIDLQTVRLYRELASRYDLYPLEKLAGKGLGTAVSDIRQTGLVGKKFVITNINNELGSFKSIFTTVQYVAIGFFVVLLLVIMVGITNTFRIVVYERTREIGTMRALGMQRGSVRSIFLFEALFLSLGGVVVGFALASLILFVVGLIKWNIMAELSFFFDGGRLLVTIDPVQFLATVLIVSMLTLLAALIPARRAARLEPAHALRTQF